MCDCIKQVEEKIKEQQPHVEKATFLSAGFVFNTDGSGKCIERTYSEVQIEYDQKFKSGKTRHRKENLNVYHSFCPFCGQKYEEKAS